MPRGRGVAWRELGRGGRVRARVCGGRGDQIPCPGARCDAGKGACLMVYWYLCTLMYFLKILLPHAYHGEHVEFYRLNDLTSFWHFQLALV